MGPRVVPLHLVVHCSAVFSEGHQNLGQGKHLFPLKAPIDARAEMDSQVVYFAATFPYVILLTLLVTGLMQPGAIDGVLFFILPTWSKLLDIQVS